MHTRSDSSRLQTRIGIPTAAGRVSIVRSLGTRDARVAAVLSEKAQALADSLPEKDWLKTKRLVEDIFIASGFPPPQIVRDALPVLRLILPFAQDYVARKDAKVKSGALSQAHFNLLQRCVLHFARNHESMELSAFKGHHLQSWADSLTVAGLAEGSVRNQLSVLSAMFGFALDMGFIAANPCAVVEVKKSSAEVLRMEMPDGDFEILRGYLQRAGEKDWLTAAMVMRYAGLRLVDACHLSAAGVTWQGDACLLCLTPGKTDTPEVLPVFDPLSGYLRAMAVASGPLAPSLASLSSSALSKQFTRLCDDARLNPHFIKLPSGRQYRRVSAHSLRHSFVTWLVRLGVPEDLRMKMSAHVDEESHRGYDHVTGLRLHQQLSSYFKQ